MFPNALTDTSTDSQPVDDFGPNFGGRSRRVRIAKELVAFSWSGAGLGGSWVGQVLDCSGQGRTPEVELSHKAAVRAELRQEAGVRGGAGIGAGVRLE
ncbi:hypothetical protein AVEN_17794-1 [Araneus ventricosus]|uniref:Uncharacterized protein n=1 Tax=Araneus ventricosus TaxID=182803 RepID=A0A4Y2MMZ5_ARAVE|nr:hypothetical protein AVEN_17794-1 [Araneus ventricosus]